MGTAQHNEVAPRLLLAGHRRDRGSCSGSMMGNRVSVQACAARFWELCCGPSPERSCGPLVKPLTAPLQGQSTGALRGCRKPSPTLRPVTASGPASRGLD